MHVNAEPWFRNELMRLVFLTLGNDRYGIQGNSDGSTRLSTSATTNDKHPSAFDLLPFNPYCCVVNATASGTGGYLGEMNRDLLFIGDALNGATPTPGQRLGHNNTQASTSPR